MAKVPGSNHEPHKGQYTFKWVIGKVTGDNEQSSVEIIANATELPVRVALAYDLLDQRMFIQNQRYLEATEMSKNLPPEMAIQVKRIIDKVHGRVSPEDVIARHQAAEKANGESPENAQP